MKERAIELCNFFINQLADAVNKNEAEPEWIEMCKESVRLWEYIRKTIEEKGE